MARTPRTRCALTVKLLTHLYENQDQAAIVGPYDNVRRITSAITSAVAAFNRSYMCRPYVVKISQRKVLVIDPVTAITEIMWEVRVVGAEKKVVKKKGQRR